MAAAAHEKWKSDKWTFGSFGRHLAFRAAAPPPLGRCSLAVMFYHSTPSDIRPRTPAPSAKPPTKSLPASDLHEEIRLPMIRRDKVDNKKWIRINPHHPYDVFIMKLQLEDINKVKLDEPVLPLGNGIHGIVFMGAVDGTKCAVRFEGFSSDICYGPREGEAGMPDPWIEVNAKPDWLSANAGLRKAETAGYGPRLYSDFILHARLVGASPANARNAKLIELGTNTVELMHETLHKFVLEDRNELTKDDFNQYCNLLIRMQQTYADTYPKMPFDLHAKNSMNKIVGGKRIWLYTDIDEGYVKPEYRSPYQMIYDLCEDNLRMDPAKITMIGSTAPAASKTRQGTVPVKPAQIGKTVRGAPKIVYAPPSALAKPPALALKVTSGLPPPRVIMVPPVPARAPPPPPRVKTRTKTPEIVRHMIADFDKKKPETTKRVSRPPKPRTPTPPAATKRRTTHKKPAASKKKTVAALNTKTVAKVTVRKGVPLKPTRGIEGIKRRQRAVSPGRTMRDARVISN